LYVLPFIIIISEVVFVSSIFTFAKVRILLLSAFAALQTEVIKNAIISTITVQFSNFSSNNL